MTKADLKLVDKTIREHGNSWWNKERKGIGNGYRQCVIKDLLAILSEADLDLKGIRKE